MSRLYLPGGQLFIGIIKRGIRLNKKKTKSISLQPFSIHSIYVMFNMQNNDDEIRID